MEGMLSTGPTLFSCRTAPATTGLLNIQQPVEVYLRVFLEGDIFFLLWEILIPLLSLTLLQHQDLLLETPDFHGHPMDFIWAAVLGRDLLGLSLL